MLKHENNAYFISGNEPNSIYHQLGVNLTSKDLGKDFHRMRKLLSTFALYNTSLVVGPDINHVRDCVKSYKSRTRSLKKSINSPRRWPSKILKFFQTAYNNIFGAKLRKKHTCKAFKYLNSVVKYSKNALDALTWHHYYLNGHSCTIKDFLNITVFNSLKSDIMALSKFVGKKGINLPMWLGETSSAYGGGSPGLSDRYVAGFLWLDKLGIVAAMNENYQVIVRQTFYHGHYALIGQDLKPNPDFWISVLYKRLVSENVIRLRSIRESQDAHALRLYAHCSKYQNSITLFGINLSEKLNFFKIHNPEKNNFKINEVHHYILSPSHGDLTSRNIELNGNILEIKGDDTLPKLDPIITFETPNKFQIPPYGMGFWVFVNSMIDIC